MKEQAVTTMRVELKYCESCGGLQVRPMGSGLLYCSKCEALHADESIPLLTLPGHRRRPRLPSGIARDIHSCASAQVAAYKQFSAHTALPASGIEARA